MGFPDISLLSCSKNRGRTSGRKVLPKFRAEFRGPRMAYRPQTCSLSQIFCEAPFAVFLALVVLCSAALAGPSSTGPSSAGEGAKFDGPAELPRVYLLSSLADTPAPGQTHLVKSGDDLQDALNHASCGDTLRLEAGATFSGLFRLAKKSCDDAHWIIIRTSATDSELPPQGTRLTPCYAGVASLPGRPDFGCTSGLKNKTTKRLK